MNYRMDEIIKLACEHMPETLVYKLENLIEIAITEAKDLERWRLSVALSEKASNNDGYVKKNAVVAWIRWGGKDSTEL